MILINKNVKIMKFKLSYIIVIISIFLISKNTFAQWDTQLGFAASFYTGNVESFNVRTDSQITRKDSIIESKLFGKIIYSETDKKRNNEEYSSGIQFDYKPYNKLTPFILFTTYRNQFKKYDLRLSGLAGAKWVIYKNLDSLKKIQSEYSISVAFVYDHEKYTAQFDTEGTDITPANKQKLRLSVRPKIKQRITENIYLQNTTFYQPNFKNFDDYFIDSETSITTKLHKRVDLGLSYEFHYISKPVNEDVENTDQTILAKLTIKF